MAGSNLAPGGDNPGGDWWRHASTKCQLIDRLSWDANLLLVSRLIASGDWLALDTENKENAKMIHNQWYVVLESEEVGAHPIGVTRLGEKMVFWRDQAGKVRAAVDRCPHRGVALSVGKIQSGHLQCPFHVTFRTSFLKYGNFLNRSAEYKVKRLIREGSSLMSGDALTRSLELWLDDVIHLPNTHSLTVQAVLARLQYKCPNPA